MIEYFAEEELNLAVSGMLENTAYTELAPLRQHDVQFHCAFMLKTNDKGEEQVTNGPPVVLRKISAADAVFLPGHYKLYVDKCRWGQASEVQQHAMLHRALMQIEVEVGDEGAVSFKSRQPDVSEFLTTVARFGAWHDSLLEMRANLQAAQAKAQARKTAAITPAAQAATASA